MSLHVTVKVDDGEYCELAETIGERELSARTCAKWRDPLEAEQLAQDINAVIAQLPHADRELLRRLKWGKVAEVARDLGVPPTTIYSRVTKYRQLFERAGLRDYLK